MTKHVQFLELLIGPLANEGGGGGTPATLIEKSISANGTYNAADDSADGYSKAVVNVQPDLQSKSVTIQQNGQTTVSPDQGKDGLSSVGVTVNVQPDLQAKSVTITENGTTNVAPDQDKDGLSGVAITVNVSGGGGSANDWAYAFISGGYSGVLTDSADPTVPRITKVITCSMEEETGLTGINLPNCTQIGYAAFTDCVNLVSVSLAACTNVMGNAFQRCEKIETLSIPLCTEIGSYAFSNLKLLQELNLPKVKYINSSSLVGKANEGSQKNSLVKLVELPELISNGGGVQYFNSMTAIRMGSAVTTLSSNAFRYLPALDTVIFGQNLASVPTMGSQFVFGGSAIRDGNGYVYVPDALEATWKTASLWSAIAAQIKPLSAITNWAAGTYAVGDVVTYSGHYYRCAASTASEPWLGPWDTTLWQDLGAIY